MRPYTGYVDFFPPFLTSYNGNRTFEFNVDKRTYAGNEYFFKIVLKEAGGRAMGIPYYFKIFIESLPEGEGGGGKDDGSESTDGGSTTEDNDG